MIEDLKRKVRLGSSLEREAAVKALAEVGGEEAVKLLEEALKDDSRYVRQAAAEALTKLGYSTTSLALPAQFPEPPRGDD